MRYDSYNMYEDNLDGCETELDDFFDKVRIKVKKINEEKTSQPAYDRFNLEESIQRAWGTVEDLDLLYEKFYEEEKIDNDEFANFVLGLKELHNARMQKVWDLFEHLIHTGSLK